MLTIPLHPSVQLMNRFMAQQRSDLETGCRIWTGTLDRDGYGRFFIEGRRFAAHRVAYTWSRGLIPDDLTVDHLCRNRACVQPEHLEVVTNRENIARGNAGLFNRSKTHCKQGHPLQGDNLYVRDTGRGCRECIRESSRRWKASQREAG